MTPGAKAVIGALTSGAKPSGTSATVTVNAAVDEGAPVSSETSMLTVAVRCCEGSKYKTPMSPATFKEKPSPPPMMVMETEGEAACACTFAMDTAEVNLAVAAAAGRAMLNTGVPTTDIVAVANERVTTVLRASAAATMIVILPGTSAVANTAGTSSPAKNAPPAPLCDDI